MNTFVISLLVLMLGISGVSFFVAKDALDSSRLANAERDVFKAGYEFVAKDQVESERLLLKREEEVRSASKQLSQQIAQLTKIKANQCADAAVADDVIELLQQTISR